MGDFLSDAVSAHLTFQTGCYIKGITQLAGGTPYISSVANDLVWNRAVMLTLPEDTFDAECIIAESRSKQRTPALAVISDQASLKLPPWATSSIPERWMFASLQTSSALHNSFISDYAIHNAAAPPDDFLDLFSELYEDESVNKFFRENYVRALREAVPGKADPYHLIQYVEGHAVSCASIYVLGKWAGLYNVGVKSSHQNRGFGTQISKAAMALAKNVGAESALLQCAVGTHVERMYNNIGFSESIVASVYVLEDAQ